MKKIIIGILSFFVIHYANAQFENNEPDEWIEYMLNKRNLDFSQITGSEGEYRIEIQTEKNRRQVGFIDSKVSYFNNEPVREIVSLVFISEEAPDTGILLRTLEINNQLKQGSFQAIHNGESYVLRYLYRVPAYSSEKQIIDGLYYAVSVADALEKEIDINTDTE